MRVIINSTHNHKIINIINEIWFFYLILGTLSWLDIKSLESIAIKSLVMIYINENV